MLVAEAGWEYRQLPVINRLSVIHKVGRPSRLDKARALRRLSVSNKSKDTPSTETTELESEEEEEREQSIRVSFMVNQCISVSES